MKTVDQIKFIIELQALLQKYNCELSVVDNGGNFRPKHEIEVLFNGGESGNEFGLINIGSSMDGSTAF